MDIGYLYNDLNKYFYVKFKRVWHIDHIRLFIFTINTTLILIFLLDFTFLFFIYFNSDLIKFSVFSHICYVQRNSNWKSLLGLCCIRLKKILWNLVCEFSLQTPILKSRKKIIIYPPYPYDHHFICITHLTHLLFHFLSKTINYIQHLGLWSRGFEEPRTNS